MADTTQAGLVEYLAIAVTTEAAVIGVLFWQLIAAKKESLDLAKETLPISTQLMTASQSLLRFIERQEEKKP